MIPLKIKKQLELAPRMHTCEACGMGNTEWHHSLTYRGKSVQEVYAIRGLCQKCHRGNNGTIYRMADIVTKLNAITEGLDHLEKNYSKSNWRQERKRYETEFKNALNENIFSKVYNVLKK